MLPLETRKNLIITLNMNCSFTLAMFQRPESLILTLKDLVCLKNFVLEAKKLIMNS